MPPVMQVMGKTTEQEIWVVSQSRKFRQSEYLVVEDADLQRPVGVVVETQTFNRFLPLDAASGFVPADVYRALEASSGYDVSQHDLHVARLRLLEDMPMPIKPGAEVREPAFGEVQHLLVRGESRRSMVLGVIKATEGLYAGMDSGYQDLCATLENGEVREQAAVPFLFDPRSMQQYPHAGIFGGSGSGKSFGLRVLLEELMKLKIPALIFDPHFELTFSEAAPEARPSSYSSSYVAYQVGADIGVNFVHLSTRDLVNLLAAAAAMSESMTNAVETLHSKGDSYASFAARVDDLAGALEQGEKGGPRPRQDGAGLPLASVNGIRWRLERLHRAGLFTGDSRPVEAALRAAKLCVVQGPVWLLNVYLAYATSSVYRQRRDYKDARFRSQAAEYFPPFIVATDEAHNFAPKAYDAPAKGILKEIAQEGRKYGVFLILATQRPTLLDETITAQLNSKFIFRTVRASDIATIKEETDLTVEETRRLPYLRSGDAFVSSAVFGRTLPVRIRMANTASPHTENPFDELSQQMNQADDEFLAQVRDQLPLRDNEVLLLVQTLGKRGVSLSVEEATRRLEALVAAGHLAFAASKFGGGTFRLP